MILKLGCGISTVRYVTYVYTLCVRYFKQGNHVHTVIYGVQRGSGQPYLHYTESISTLRTKNECYFYSAQNLSLLMQIWRRMNRMISVLLSY